MNHEEIRHKLSEFIDGATAPGEKTVIEDHLAACTECSDALRELRKTIEHIHEVENVESPAWMTQKIMAKVREEQKAKNTFWQRVFVPLFTMLPVQAVAVLFLSVTAFYLYTTMHPAEKYAEAPFDRLAKQQANERPHDAQKQTAPAFAERREKKAAQKPGYESLDMKYEYERPTPPAPAAPGAAAVASREDPAASAPSPAAVKREAQMYAQDKADMHQRAAASKSAAPSMMMAEQAGPTPEAKAMNADKSLTAVSSLKQKSQIETCLSYVPSVSVLSGVINNADFPGPPNYESIAKGDKRETFWILKLDRSVCVSNKGNDLTNIAESGMVQMQLVLSAKQYELYRDVLSKSVVVRGTLFHSHTGHHHTPVLISVQSIELLSK